MATKKPQTYIGEGPYWGTFNLFIAFIDITFGLNDAIFSDNKYTAGWWGRLIGSLFVGIFFFWLAAKAFKAYKKS